MPLRSEFADALERARGEAAQLIRLDGEFASRRTTSERPNGSPRQRWSPKSDCKETNGGRTLEIAIGEVHTHRSVLINRGSSSNGAIAEDEILGPEAGG